METTSVRARRPGARGMLRPVRILLGGGNSPAAFLSRQTFGGRLGALLGMLFLLRCILDAQQGCGLGAEAVQFLVLRLILVHPRDGLVVPLAGFLLVAELPVGHREEEKVLALAA